jgi:dTDP-4-dehydrorhamnose 3,5-epimerase
MDVFELAIEPVVLLKPKRFADTRGYFSEIYNRRLLNELGRGLNFVQDNLSCSRERGTVRGLHFQIRPFEQTKMVSVLKGSILDVVVDIRVGSPTFGRHVSAELSSEDGLQLLVPPGFAHGFCTLLPDTLVHYKVDGYYDSEHDMGLRWNDPALAIAWPIAETEAQLSDRDQIQPLLAELPPYFHFEGDRQ